MTAHLNLDTRRDAIALTVDLNDASELIPLVIFDAPDDLRAPAKLSLVSLEARTSHRAAGWRNGGGELSEEVQIDPKGQATLAISREWLAERVAVLRAQGAGETAAIVDMPFSTILHLPRAPRASARRMARISVTASASRPAVTLKPETLDLDNLPLENADCVARIAIEIPQDIIFEANRSLIVETTCAGLPGENLAIEVSGATEAEVSVRRIAAPSGISARHLVTIERADELAGHTLALDLTLDRQALLGVIDRLLEESQGKPAQLRISARISGWGDGGAAAANGEAPDRRFVLSPPAVVATAGSQDAHKLLIAIGDSTHAVSFEDGEASAVEAAALVFEADPEAASEIVRYGGLKLGILRWPLGRVGSVEITAETRVGDITIAEPSVRLTPNIDREKGQSRQAHTLLPLRNTITRLAQIVRSGEMPGPELVRLRLTVANGGRRLVEADVPIRLARAVHRMPVCIDLGASAISIWSGPPRGADQAFDMKPLAMGAWLAANVDPSHEEARTLDGDAAVLIPSHISLDPANSLRSDHAPFTLRDPLQIGSGREAARARMEAFGRRYDVSVPGPPPVARSRTGSRRLSGLKHALSTGQQTLQMAEPVNRFDPASGKVTTTSIIDVPPLVADVLDELMDLYVMRLGHDGRGHEAGEPPPVAPRVVVTCPSGIGGEVQARYAAALDIFARRLDRLFPGASSFADAALPLPEAVAAARYAADVLAPEMTATAGEPLYLLTLDLGASTSDVAVSRVTVQAGRLQKFDTIATFGIPAGGNAIDEALTRLIAPLIDGMLAASDSGWSPAFDAPTLGRALASDEVSCINAQQWFHAALRQGKAALTDALLAAPPPYRWAADGPAFDIVLAAKGAEGPWRGLCQPTGIAAEGERALAPHAHLSVETDKEGVTRLILRLARPALEGDSEAARALDRVVRVLGVHLQRMARSVVPAGAKRPRVYVAPTGRAALWPPLFEALANEAESGRDGFPLKRPFTPAIMKKAVVAGAALLSGPGDSGSMGVAMPCPLGLAVLGTHLSEQADGALRTGVVAERVFYLSFGLKGGDRIFSADDGEAPSLAARADLGQRFQFVRAAPGLDPKGQMLSELREVLGHQDPMVLLEGDIMADARAERIDRFGICEITSMATGADSRRVSISARDRAWEGVWQIDGDRVMRVS
jgi:hypothetical protein